MSREDVEFVRAAVLRNNHRQAADLGLIREHVYPGCEFSRPDRWAPVQLGCRSASPSRAAYFA